MLAKAELVDPHRQVATSQSSQVIRIAGFDIALFMPRPSRPSQKRAKPKETRSVSEG